MRRQTWAMALNVIVPGAGLWYCGENRLAITNLTAAVLLPVAAWIAGFPPEHLLWLFLAIAAASGGIARAVVGETPSD